MRAIGIPTTKKATPPPIAVICHPYKRITSMVSPENINAKVEHADTIANARTRLRTNHFPSVPITTTLVIEKTPDPDDPQRGLHLQFVLDLGDQKQGDSCNQDRWQHDESRAVSIEQEADNRCDD